jgi:hypothetical protein
MARTAPLRASSCFARGLVARARGDLAAAERELEDAVDLCLWSRMQAPYELARGLRVLAELTADVGRPEEAERALRRARAARPWAARSRP